MIPAFPVLLAKKPNPLQAWLSGATAAYYSAATFSNEFQEWTGTTPVAANGDRVGLLADSQQWGGRTLAQVEAAATDLYPVVNFTSGWTASSPFGSIVDADEWAAVGGAGGVFTSGLKTVGDLIRVEYQIGLAATSRTYALRDLASAAAGNQLGSFTGTSGTILARSVALTTGFYINANQATASVRVDKLSVKKIPGFAADQPTSGDRLTVNISGQRYTNVGDATGDNLLSTWLWGASANTILIDADVPASLGATQIVFGSSGSGTARMSIGINTSGFLCAGVGSNDTTVAVGNIDWRGRRVIAAVTVNGTTVSIYSLAGIEYSGAQSGAPTTTIPARILATNNNGSAANFYGSGFATIVPAQKFLDFGTFQAIANQWLSS